MQLCPAAQAAATSPLSPTRQPGAALRKPPALAVTEGAPGATPSLTSLVFTLPGNQVSAGGIQDDTLLPRHPGEECSTWASRTERALTWFCLTGTKL